jgi:hypothetical protein
MDKKEKEKFVKDLLNNIKEEVLKKVKYMPENWDGRELRHYITDYTTEQIDTRYLPKNTKRYKEYKNVVNTF